MNEFSLIVLIIVGTIMIAGLVAHLMGKKKNGVAQPFSDTETIGNASVALVKNRQSGELTVPIDLLPATTKINEVSLFEITEHSVVSRITQTIPAIAETATRTAANNALKGMEVYRAIIPGGASLTKSQDMTGAVRGIFHGAKGVKGHANLVKVDLSKTTAVANGVANVMNVGSLVVGQYYMSEINSKLESMGKTVDKISDFQDREFKSRILSLIARVGKISQFSSEILDSDELRNRKLQTLEDLEGEGVQLLQQVNLGIDETIKKNKKQSYKEYQESVDDFSILIGYQQYLLSVLEQISKLAYLLGKGESSSEMCYSMYNTYWDQSNKIRALLENWHQKQVETLGIDINKNRKNKTGFEGFFATIPGLIDEKWHYKELANGLGQKINAQKAQNQLMLNEHKDVYDKDVQIIIKDGKYFYLAGEQNGDE